MTEMPCRLLGRSGLNYRGGQSEEMLGELLEGQRHEFVVSTKYTVARGADPNAGGNHRKNLRLSLETSLRRLKTDYVGISDAPAWVVARANTLAELRDWTPFVGLQVPYSLIQRDIERDLLPMAEAFGMTVAAWSPLAGGVLSGKFTGPADPEAGTRISPSSVSDRDRAIAVAVQQVATDVGATPSQVAIAWTMHRSPAVHPIIGARRVSQLLDNLGCLEIDLPPEAIERLETEAAFAPGFPNDFIAETGPWVFGSALTRLEG